MAAEAHAISPELVLVSPELREHALRLLPPLDEDALFTIPPRPAPPPPEPLRLFDAEPAPQRGPVHVPEPTFDLEWERPRVALADPAPPRLPVAVAVYATEALVLSAVRAAGLTAAVAILAFLLAR